MKAEVSAKIHQILEQYWGYREFRPLQEDIILSILARNDTLALLPTGGGKSICFQVPALAMEGVCLVISPLIALMKDQVEQLQARKIAAVAIHSGLSRREIDNLLDNCIYGQVKFLYLSPERMQTELFKERVKNMNLSMLVVDEAHCISQWGYDFRPAYLKVSEFRQSFPEIPCIALTATATEIVKTDIQEKLLFKSTKEVFQKSYSRANLSYSSFYEEDKPRKLLEILQKVPGSAIVYVSSRKHAKEVALFLQKNKLIADYYHAGLSHEQRTLKQDNWIKNKTRIIVATNAFGMGIDKADVRVVVHLELPSTLEAYYQEAGRAGRDEKKAYAVALYDKSDLQNLEINVLKAYPSEAALRRVYQTLANYYQLAAGSGQASYDFDFLNFIETFHLDSIETHFALKILGDEGIIQLSEAYFNPSKLMFILNKSELYAFQIANKSFDLFIQTILRIYGGELFTHFYKISEAMIAQHTQLTPTQVVQLLEQLEKMRVLIYEKQKDKPQLTFLSSRYSAESLPLDIKKIEARKERDLRKAKSVAHYVQHTNRCRTQLLLEYFGEVSYEPCGICDICLKKRKEHRLSENHYEQYRERILKALEIKSLLMDELIHTINPRTREALVEAIQKVIEVGEVEYLDDGRLRKA